MIETTKLKDVEQVPCEFCLKDVPKSAAQRAQAWDHTAYFCGLECYEEWAAEQIRERTQESGEP